MTTTWSEEAVSQLRRLVGDIDDAKVSAILALNPTLQEIEEAVIWIEESGELRPDGEWRLSGKAGEIFDILTADLEDESRAH